MLDRQLFRYATTVCNTTIEEEIVTGSKMTPSTLGFDSSRLFRGNIFWALDWLRRSNFLAHTLLKNTYREPAASVALLVVKGGLQSDMPRVRIPTEPT